MPAAPGLRLNLVALAVSASPPPPPHTPPAHPPHDSSVACPDANVFDHRPVALEVVVRGTVTVCRARVWKLGRIFTVVVRTLVIVVQAALCSLLTQQAGVWLNSRYPTCTTDLTS